jgi:MoxR-like ATPase
MTASTSAEARDRFASLGVYGFAKRELPILAALVTEDPLLLVGRSGTGKTYLLNSISEALGLEHRHYNASLISFDDLVGFPYPDDAKESVRFLQTPATIWRAESVLVDEISRCKPEHQNRLFSLVHERRVQGIALTALRYRWAAMNPCSADQSGSEEYLGSEPLDPALADRFAVIVDVGDWDELSAADRKRIVNPAGEGSLANDAGALKHALALWRQAFERQLPACAPELLDYACAAVTALRDAGIRISPRRARLLARTLLAAGIIDGEFKDKSFRTVLEASLPHRTWGEPPPPDKVLAAHRLAWDAAMLTGEKQWVHRFHLEHSLAGKVKLLRDTCPGPDAGTLAVEQLLANESKERAAAFALAVYPAALAGALRIGAEGINDLGRLASQILSVDGEISWQERLSDANSIAPEYARIGPVLAQLKGSRLERARQLFYWCLINKVSVEKPLELEADFDAGVRTLADGKRP